MEKTFRAIWKQQNVSGRIEIHNSGCVTGIDCAAGGCGCADADSFCTESGSAVITVKDAQLEKAHMQRLLRCVPGIRFHSFYVM